MMIQFMAYTKNEERHIAKCYKRIPSYYMWWYIFNVKSICRVGLACLLSCNDKASHIYNLYQLSLQRTEDIKDMLQFLLRTALTHIAY